MNISRNFLFIFLFLTNSLFAQKTFKVGLSLGLSASQYDGDTYGGYHKAGITGGAFVRKKFNPKWDGQFEIIYTQKGAIKNPDPEQGDYSQYELYIDYIEVPVVAKWHYKAILLEAGLGFGRLIKTKEIVNGTDFTGIRNFYKTEMSYFIGAGYALSKHLELNARLTYSLLPVRPHLSGLTFWFNRGEYNNGICFTLKYLFGNTDEQ